MKIIARSLIALTILSALICSGVSADPVNVSDLIYFNNREGSTDGGEFGVAWTAGGADIFRTFCMQTNETLNMTDPFVVANISTTVKESNKPLDFRTAYLYTQFRNGTLSSYDYTPNSAGHIASADALQKAFWWIQNEAAGDNTGQSGLWITEATNAGWTSVGDVRVINLAYVTGAPAQDVLVLHPVPEPISMALAGIGLATVGAIRRRRVA